MLIEKGILHHVRGMLPNEGQHPPGGPDTGHRYLALDTRHGGKAPVTTDNLSTGDLYEAVPPHPTGLSIGLTIMPIAQA